MRRTPLAIHALTAALGFALLPAFAFAGDGQDIDKVMGSITALSGQSYGDLSTVNGSVHVEASAKTADISTVNGSVRVEDGATIGDAQTVNGSIRSGERIHADDLETVNGSIRIGARGQANSVHTVNGSIFTDRGTMIAKDVETVNGAIGLVDTDVNGSISTVSGDVTVGIDSHVQGGLTVEKPTSRWSSMGLSQRRQRIIIGPGAVVDGPLVFKREVVLYVHSTARVGQITGATAIPYSTPTAPKD